MLTVCPAHYSPFYVKFQKNNISVSVVDFFDNEPSCRGFEKLSLVSVANLIQTNKYGSDANLLACRVAYRANSVNSRSILCLSYLKKTLLCK